jgi:hypothetical protein
MLAITQPTGAAATGIGGLIQKLAGGAATAAPAATQLNMFAPATAAAAGQLGIMTKLMGLWTGLSAAVGGFIAPLTTAVGWTNLLTGAVGALLSPLGLVVAGVALFIAAWQTNAAGIQEFIYERFGGIATYLGNFWNILSEAFSRILNVFTSAGTSIANSTFMQGIAEVFKGVIQIIEGFIIYFGGAFKVIIGILAGDGALIGEGFKDIMVSVMTMLGGLARAALGIIEGAVLGVVDIVNLALGAFGVSKIDTSGITKFFDSGTDLMKIGTKTANSYSKGFQNGLTDSTQKTGAVVSTFIKKSTTEPIEKALIIKSPSGKTYFYGTAVGQGFANGIRDMTPKVADAITTMNDVVIESFKQTNQEMLKSAKQQTRIMETAINHMVTLRRSGVTGEEMVYVAKAVSRDAIASTTQAAKTSVKTLDMGVEASKSRFGYEQVQNVIGSATKQEVVKQPTSLMGMTSAQRNALILQNTPQFVEKYGIDVSPERLAQIVDEEYAKRYSGRYSPEKISELRQLNRFGDMAGTTTDMDISQIVRILNLDNTPGEYAELNRGDYKATQAWEQTPAYLDAVKTINQKTGMTMSRPTYVGSSTATISKEEKSYFNRMLKLNQVLKKSSIKTAEEVAILNDYYLDTNYVGEKYFDATLGKFMYKTISSDDFGVASNIPASLIESGKTQQVGLSVEATRELENSMQIVAKEMTKGTELWTNKSMKWLGTQTDTVRELVTGVLHQRADDSRIAGAAAAATMQGGDDISRYTGGAATRGGSSSKTYKNDPYNFWEWIERGTKDKRSDFIEPYEKTLVTYRQKSGKKVKAQNVKQAYIPVSQLPQAASFFSDQLVPEQYDSEFGDVSTGVAGFKMQYGDAGIKFRGLTDTFANTPGLMEQYGQVGNRAATFLSLKKGQKMTAEDYAEFQRLMALDREDKDRYLIASSKLQTELNAIDKDPTLNAEQKAQKKAKAVQGMQWDNTSLTGSYRDILGVDVDNLADYDKRVADGEITGDVKTYADTAYQRVREGIATAVDPKNQSAAFKALTPEEQDKLKKAVGDLPLAASAYLGQAMMDGVMTNDERILMEMYSQQDAERLGRILAAGVMPTQADIDAGFQPYVDGTAKFAERKDIVGTMAESYLEGFDNLVAGAGLAHGQQWTTNFLKGVGTDAEGNKIDVAQMSAMDIISLDPDKVKAEGIKTGIAIPQGVAQGIIDGATEVDKVITEYYGPGGVFQRRVVSQPNGIDSDSPSKLYAREVGLPMVQGVAKGIADNAYLVSDAMAAAVGASSPAIPAGGAEGMGDVGSEGASRAAAGAASLNSGPFFAMGRQSATQFIAGFFNEQTPAESLFTKLFYKLQLGFTPDVKNQNAISLFTAASDLGRLLARKVVDVGFAEYIDDKEGKSDWTFNTVLATALGHTSDGSGADGWGVAAEKVGENIAAGVAKGMNNEAAKAAIKAAAEKLIEAAVKAAENAGTIESPSKLFADKIGANITAGVAMGIGENSNLVDKAISGVISSPVQRNYQPDISAVALAGKRQAAVNQISNEYNYNLGVQTNQSPQLVQRSFAVMSAFQGE